jgi:uncharacterized membrane protein
LESFAEKALTSVGEKVSEKVSETAQMLLEKAKSEDGGGPGVKAAISGVTALTEGKGPVRAALSAGATGLKEKVKQLFGGGRGKKALKLTNIVETLDVGVPLRLAYNQWSQFEDFPHIMKKVEHVERQPDEEKSNWKAQIWWSHRSWEATVLEQVPDDHIVWRSKAPKGHVDGAVSFSGLAPNLTRICLVMEYHPQGFFEHTGNLWRAQGRRARLEFKHFRRHVMAHAILKPDEVEGWRGEIRDGQVVKTHEEALEEEERAQEEEEKGAAPEPTEAPREEEEGAEEEAPEEGRAGAEEGEEPREQEPREQETEPREARRPRRRPEGDEGRPEARRPRRRPEGDEEDEEARRPRRRPEGDEGRPEPRPRRRPAAGEEERPPRGRRPAERRSPEPRDQGDEGND